MRNLPTIDVDRISVASPCDASWDAMTPVREGDERSEEPDRRTTRSGDNRVRHCGDCQKNVYQLTDLTRGEISDLIREQEGALCVRFYRRRDGTVLTADCPVGLAARLRRRARSVWGKVAATFLFALPAFASGCRSDAVQGEIEMGDMVMMGEVECATPAGPPPRELAPKLHELQGEDPNRKPDPVETIDRKQS